MNKTNTLSASRNPSVASVFVVASAIIVFAGWHSLGRAVPTHRDTALLLMQCGCIVVCLMSVAAFQGFRERLVIGIVILGLAKGLIAGLIPQWVAPYYSLVCCCVLVLDVVALLLTFSMLVSANKWRGGATP